MNTLKREVISEMRDKVGIVLVGLNGSGKSTLGKAVAEEFDLQLLEVEDYWFPVKHEYNCSRSAEEVSCLMLEDIKKAKWGFVITGNIMNLSKELLNYLTLVIYLEVPIEVRMERIKKRELAYFGELISGNKNYKERESFYEFARNRSSEPIEKWLSNLTCKIIRLDGTNSIEEKVRIVEKEVYGNY